MTDTPGNEYSNPVSGCLSSLPPFGYIVISTGWVNTPGCGLWWCWCSFLRINISLSSSEVGLDGGNPLAIHCDFELLDAAHIIPLSSSFATQISHDHKIHSPWIFRRRSISPQMSSIEVVRGLFWAFIVYHTTTSSSRRGVVGTGAIIRHHLSA